MRRKTSLRLWAMCSLLTLMLTVSMMVPAIHAEGDEEDQFQIPEKEDLRYPNLGSRLSDLVVRVEDGEVSAGEATEETVIHREESIAVTTHLAGNVDEVVEFLVINGGDPRNVGEDYVEAYVPVSLLGQLSQQPGVIRVREIIPPQYEFGPITSQGVAAHAAVAWHDAGYDGRGIKVGILDVGFEGFRDLMGTELPSMVIARCYTDVGRYTQSLADCDVDDAHDTAVAEAVMDVAPGVSLYIANPVSSGDMQEAARWMTSQGVSIINRSASFPFQGPGDGTSPFSWSSLRTIDQAVSSGSIWINSAGNYNQKTWFSDSPAIWTSSRTNNSFVAFDGVDDFINGLRGLGENVQVQLRWDDAWDGASSDLNLGLFDFTRGEYVAGSADDQTGQRGDIPTELIRYRLVDNRLYGIVVQHSGGNVPEWIQVMVRGSVSFGRIAYYTEGHSINNASESANLGLLAAGAAHYWDTHTIADYSSRGPAPDGRFKPDIVGTACAETASYEHFLRKGQDCWFPGTSQAAPHVAGMAALVRQRFPDFTPVEVAGYLKDHAGQRGRIPNNTWGYGFAELPPHDAPTITVPGAPIISSVASGQNSLTVAWTMPEDDGGATITTYDLRFIRSDTTDKAGGNWSVVSDLEASGTLEFTITGLEDATGYDMQVRAANSVGPGPWSATATGQTDASTNLPPVFTLVRSIEENAAAGTPVGDPVTATDPEGGTLTYVLSGTGSASFIIGDSSGQITVGQGAELDYDTQSSYAVTVVVTDDGGMSDSVAVTINVTDVDEAPPAPADPCVERLSGDGTSSGTWTSGCESEVPGRGHARFYSFTLAEESEVAVALESQDADPYLYLRQGAEAKSGTPLHENDDHDNAGLAKSTDSQIRETLAAGTYTIEATTYSTGEIGSFTLTVTGLGSATTPQPPEPAPADPCGLTNVSSDDSGDRFVGLWDASCESQTPALGLGSGPRFARFLSIRVVQELEMNITLESHDADTYLYLREGDARSGTFLYENDDAEPGNIAMSQIRQTLAAGSYTVEATTYEAGETGSFTLTIQALRSSSGTSEGGREFSYVGGGG